MNSSRYFMLWLLLPLLGFSWLLLAAVEPNGPGPLDYVLIGYLIGTLFGQATLASAWMALGPLPLLWRLPLSLSWVAALAIAFIVNVSNSRGPNLQIALIAAGCIG